MAQDPGETTNIVSGPETQFLREELVRAGLDLGLDLRGMESAGSNVKALMAMDGSVILEGGGDDNHYWAYGEAAEKIVERPDGGFDTLWYLAGPDGYTLRVPANIEVVRMATVVARNEEDTSVGKAVRVVAHPDSAITFESSERVSVHVTGSRGDDLMIGPVYAGAFFDGGEGDDTLIARSSRRKDRHEFYGGPGNDTLIGGNGRDILDGGSGDDVIRAGHGFARIFGGPGNDTITVGNSTSTIHTGPGRNTVVSGQGKDTFHIGPGENRITGGPGDKTYLIDWGGVCIITDWSPGSVIDLANWPGAPTVTVENGALIPQRGLSFVVLQGCDDPAAIEPFLRLPKKA